MISPSEAIRLAGTLLVYCVGLMVTIACIRGIWFDEIWSMWASGHDIPLKEIIEQRWLKDVHPPLFYALNWILEPITGLSIQERRLENIGALAIFLLSAYALAREAPGILKFLVIFVVLYITNTYSINYFGEYRSYFIQSCLFSICLITMYSISARGADFNRKNDIFPAVILFVSMIISLNIHYIGTFIAGISIGAFLLDQIRMRHWRWSFLIVFAGLISAIPLLSLYWLESRFIGATAAEFWADTSFPRALRIIGSVVRESALGNIVAAVCGGAVVLGLWRKPTENQGDEQPESRVPWSFVLAMATALTIASAALLAVNQVRPIVVDRYLINMTPIVSIIVAAAATAPLWSSRLVFAAFLINGAITATVVSAPEIRTQRWYDTARYIRTQIKACPTAQVYALAPGTQGSQRLEVNTFGYRLVAGYFGFPIKVIRSSDTSALKVSHECPTLFWGEAMADIDVKTLADAPFARGLSGAGLKDAPMHRDDTGFVLALPPQSLTAGLRLSARLPAAPRRPTGETR